jgi:acetyl-CoA acetyltransferase
MDDQLETSWSSAMREAVIVSTARTPIGKAFRGALNNIKSPTLVAHAMRHAVERARIEPGEIEDVVIGTVLTAGTAGMNVARNAAFAAGIPVTAGAQTIDRQCASGLTAIAAAAKAIVVDGSEVAVAGGHDNISAVQKRYLEWVAARARSERHAAGRARVHADAADRGDGGAQIQDQSRGAGCLCAVVAAAHRAGAGGGTLRRRDRPHHGDDGGDRQGDERSVVQGSHAVEG